MTRFFVRIVVWLAAAVFFCSTASSFTPPRRVLQNTTAEETHVTVYGHIGVFGSEPHMYPGIVTDDGKKYALRADTQTVQALMNRQGIRLCFTGTVVPPSSHGTGL